MFMSPLMEQHAPYCVSKLDTEGVEQAATTAAILNRSVINGANMLAIL
jgi:hypothetical protein